MPSCRESTTQTAAPTLVPNEDGGVTNQFYFSFPIDVQLIAKEKAAAQEWPVLHFEVFEKDSWDRIYMQGCGFMKIPTKPGAYIIDT